MPHPKMFDDDDPILAQVRRIALSLPEAAEKISHGSPAFYTTKVFAYYGASVRVDGAWQQHPQAVVVQADESDRAALRELPGSFIPAYLGPSGWIGIDLDDHADWDEVRELLLDSYLLTAPRRLSAALLQQTRRPQVEGPH